MSLTVIPCKGKRSIYVLFYIPDLGSYLMLKTKVLYDVGEQIYDNSSATKYPSSVKKKSEKNTYSPDISKKLLLVNV